MVELRDGSRVVGTALEKNLQFYSTLLGKINLPVNNLRSVECGSMNTAKLITTNGDNLTVWFVDPKFALKTSFGKIEIAVDSLRKFTVRTAGAGGARRPGLVALWSGEDNGKDSVGNQDAELTGITFAEGKVGQAFALDEDNSTIKVPGGPALNVGVGKGLTISVWMKPSNIAKNNPIVEWVQDGFRGGTQFYIYPPHGGPGTLYAMFADIEGNPHYFSAAKAVMANVFQHVALTYDRESGAAEIYCNGTMVAQQYVGNFIPQTGCDLYLGKRPLINGETYQFSGILDEVAVYDRALSASEIQEICTSDNQGELLPKPTATIRPSNRRPLWK